MAVLKDPATICGTEILSQAPWLVEWTINMESVVCSWFRDSKALVLTELEASVEIAIALALQQLLSF